MVFDSSLFYHFFDCVKKGYYNYVFHSRGILASVSQFVLALCVLLGVKYQTVLICLSGYFLLVNQISD